MERLERAPNRLLDLEELESPGFRRTLAQLDALVARDDVSYLHPSKRWEYPWALERARLEPGSEVLDAGGGDSIFPVYLASLGARVTALDLDFTAHLGDLHGVRARYVRGDMASLPLADCSFDAVFCISVIEHFAESAVPVAMQEMRRVLNPGGCLLLTTDYYEDAEAEICYTGPGRDAFRVDWRVFDEERLRRLLLEAPGFRQAGELDLRVDWAVTRDRMRAYHGYPYTSVGVALVRE